MCAKQRKFVNLKNVGTFLVVGSQKVCTMVGNEETNLYPAKMEGGYLRQISTVAYPSVSGVE